MWGFIWSTGVIAIYLAVGVFAFGVVLSVDIVGTVLVVVMGIGTFIGFSMIGAGILILTKQGDPVTTVITIATNLFGNVLFPPQVMPQALQVISYFVPQYYFFTTIRQVLTGATLQAILPDLLVLILMCAVILPLGYLVYSWCLRTAKKNGTLSWF
jgi:ABC-2 type transport system permease protein